MRILVISLSFPPVADAEAYCSGKFVQALIDSGHETRVIFSSDVHRPPRVDQSSMWDSIKRVSFDMPLRSSIPRWESLWLAPMHCASFSLRARGKRSCTPNFSRSLPTQCNIIAEALTGKANAVGFR